MGILSASFEGVVKCACDRVSRSIWTDKPEDAYGFIFLMPSCCQCFYFLMQDLSILVETN